MNIESIVSIFILIIIILGLSQYQLKYTVPVVRPAIEATWPMYPGAKEGFVGSAGVGGLVSAQGITTPELKAWLPAPEVLTKSNGAEEVQKKLDTAAPYEAGIGKPFKSYDLLPGGKPEPRVAGGPTSQKCYEVDWARGLERAGSYAQRTNNYIHGYPDSCSAPYHELVLNFYKEKPMAAPYQV